MTAILPTTSVSDSLSRLSADRSRQLTESAEFLSHLRNSLERAGVDPARFQEAVEEAGRQIHAKEAEAGQKLVAPTPFAAAAQTSPPATVAPQAAKAATLESAVEGATVKGRVDGAALAFQLGGRIAYEPPNWTGSPYALPDPLLETWVYLPEGGRINMGYMLYSLNVLNAPEDRTGALASMVQTAKWLAGHQEAGLYGQA
jgi:hypothetical protein